MTDYARMTKAELIARLQALEARPIRSRKSSPPKTPAAAISETEERLLAILRSAVEGIITIDERGIIESMNPAAESLFGYTAAEMTGKNISGLMPSPYNEAHDGYLRKYLQTGEAKVIGIGREVTGLRKDGSLFPIDLAVSEVRLPNRRLFVGFIRDITDRKEAERALSYYPAIVASTEDAIFGRGMDGLVTSWNRGAELLFGYSAEEIVGRPISVLVPPERKPLEAEVIARIERGESIKSLEVPVLRKDGTQVEISVTISPIRVSSGRIVGASIVARNITDRKRMFAALRRQADLLHLSHDAIVVWRLGGGIENWNRGAEELYGYSESEVLGRVSHQVLQTTFPEPWPKIEAALRLGNWTGELRHHTRSGKELVVAARLQLVGGEDGVPRVLETIRDITEQKLAEEKLTALAQSLSEKNKELETIVYIASHDLRSPLVNIQGFSRELIHSCNALRARFSPDSKTPVEDADVQRWLNRDIPEAVEFIQAGVRKIDTLLAGFLRYSRLGRVALKPERLEMNQLIAGIAQAMEFQFKNLGVIFKAEKLPPCRGDSTLISQVFSNLIENAIKYRSPKRACKITVSGHMEHNRSLYCVRDNGIGIAPDHQAKIFEIFHRLNPDATEGEGLGLTITQRILERHNGKIWVESDRDKGATFFVSLPADTKTS
jgi:PAS domain S-box-containing protein